MKILGINDEVTTCECCGRTNLKKTVVLSTGEGEVRYGTACAAKAMGRKESSVKAEAVGVLEMAYRSSANAFEDELRAFVKGNGKSPAIAYAFRGDFAATPRGASLKAATMQAHAAWKAGR